MIFYTLPRINWQNISLQIKLSDTLISLFQHNYLGNWLPKVKQTLKTCVCYLQSIGTKFKFYLKKNRTNVTFKFNGNFTNINRKLCACEILYSNIFSQQVSRNCSGFFFEMMEHFSFLLDCLYPNCKLEGRYKHGIRL